MNNITDKELLAICNLSNLRMEFANLVKETEEKDIEKNGKKERIKVDVNHTISSLMQKEIQAIREGKPAAERAFRRELENEKGFYSSVHDSLDDLKCTAGIVYEYCENLEAGGETGKFLDDWEILYGGENLI